MDADTRYRFMLAICDAIEAFTSIAVRNSGAAYLHRGANLRYAIERVIYFVAVNDGALLNATTRAWLDQVPVHEEGLSSSSRLIAPLLSPPRSTKGASTERTRPRPLYVHYSRLSDRRKDRTSWSTHGDVKASPTLFLVIQYKFVRFLRPIFDRLESAAFLVIDDAVLADRLIDEGLPVVHVVRQIPPPPDKRLSSGLIEFASIAEQFNAVLSAFRTLTPDCVVIPEGNAPANEVTNQVCHRLGIPSLCVQQGWSPIVHSGFRNMSYDRMLVWGEGFADVLRPWNPGQRFLATGHHLLRVETAEAHRKEAIGFFPQTGGPLLSEWASEEFLGFIEWTAATFPDRTVLVRDHPSSPLDDRDRARLGAHRNLEFTPPEKATLDEVLSRCAVAVAIYSTTILEAMAAGTLPLILNFTGLPHYNPDLAKDGAAIEVKTPADARSVLGRLMSGLEQPAFYAGREAVVHRYFACDRDAALGNIVDEITSARHRPR